MGQLDAGGVGTSSAPASSADAGAVSPRMGRKHYLCIVVAVGLGILLEWYDFLVFAQLMTPLTKNFFPSGAPGTEALMFWGVFAMGFVARPVGSILFGHVGDMYGRKPCLVATVSIMGCATVLIGCLPTHAMIGVAAPVLLALLRIVQGLAMGGEFGTSLVYLHECAPPRRKGLAGALGFAAAIFGIAVGVSVVMIVTAACSADQLALWGWRLPFLLAAVTAMAAVLMRMHMREPDEWVTARRKLAAAADTAAAEPGAAAAAAAAAHHALAATLGTRAPFAALLAANWWRLGLQFVFEASVSVSFWLCTSYLPGYFQKSVGLGPELSLGMLLFNLAAMCPAILLSGAAADRDGFPRVVGALAAYVAAGALAVPMFIAFQASKTVAICWLLQLAYMLLLAWVLGMLPVSMSVLYPPTQRSSGFNFAHNCAMSLMGGLAPTVVTAIGLAASAPQAAPGWYMLAVTAASIAAGIAVMLLVPETNCAAAALAPPSGDAAVELA